jgi:hypothetical protein
MQGTMEADLVLVDTGRILATQIQQEANQPSRIRAWTSADCGTTIRTTD